jgi:hypothetical protein
MLLLLYNENPAIVAGVKRGSADEKQKNKGLRRKQKREFVGTGVLDCPYMIIFPFQKVSFAVS